MADAARSVPSEPFSVLIAPPMTGGDESSETGLSRDGNWLVDGFIGTAGPNAGWLVDAAGGGRRVLELAEPVDLTNAATARLSLRSWLTGFRSHATIEVSVDGVTWETVYVAGASDTWIPLEIDLTPWVGDALHVRFVFEAVAPSSGEMPDMWRFEDIGIESD